MKIQSSFILTFILSNTAYFLDLTEFLFVLFIIFHVSETT